MWGVGGFYIGEANVFFLYKVVYLNKKDLIGFYDCMRASTFCATQIIFKKKQILMRNDQHLYSDHTAFSLLLWVEQLPHIACTFESGISLPLKKKKKKKKQLWNLKVGKKTKAVQIQMNLLISFLYVQSAAELYINV